MFKIATPPPPLPHAPTTVPAIPLKTPALIVILTGAGGELTAGEPHVLTCKVTGGEGSTTTYRWFKDGSLLTSQTSAILSFSPLRETDTGVYTCEGTRGSTGVSPTGVSITVVGEYEHLSRICLNEFFLSIQPQC